MSKENISNQNTRDKKLFVPVIDEQHVYFIEFELDTFAPRIPHWQETIFFQSTPRGNIPGMETYEEEVERHRRIWQERIMKEREKVHINKRFNVLYARGEMYFIRIFYEEITESEFNKQTRGLEVVLTDLKHELDYGRWVC